MTPVERDRIMLRLQAAWPKPIADAQAMVWAEHLTPMGYNAAAEALGMLERTSPRQPALSDFHEAYAAARAAKPSTVLERPSCVVCEDGWAFVSHNTVAPCPNGCLPPTRAEREARRLAEDREWFAQREKRVSSVAKIIEPGAAYPPSVAPRNQKGSDVK